MKKVILFLTLTVLYSCVESDNMSNDCGRTEHFVIRKIERDNNRWEKYKIYSQWNYASNLYTSFGFTWSDSIGKFKIGDTLILVKK